MGLFSLVLALLLLVWSSTQAMPKTPAGTHCPTAAIQWVAAPAPSGAACCLVKRKPVPADRIFVQCRCAEKHGAQAYVASSAKLHLLTPPDTELPQPLVIRDVSPAHLYVAASPIAYRAPTPLPPKIA